MEGDHVVPPVRLESSDDLSARVQQGGFARAEPGWGRDLEEHLAGRVVDDDRVERIVGYKADVHRGNRDGS